MKIASPVRNKNGMILIPADTQLTEKHIQTIKSWGIQSVEVTGGASQGADDTSVVSMAPAARAELKREIDEMFEGVLDNPVMRVIRRNAIQQLVQRRLVD